MADTTAGVSASATANTDAAAKLKADAEAAEAKAKADREAAEAKSKADADAAAKAAAAGAPSASAGASTTEDGKVHSSSKEAPANTQVVLDHGEEANVKEDSELGEPWYGVPAQMRDDHDPAVDPKKVGTTSGSLIAAPVSTTNALEPQADENTEIEGGTNAPA